LINDLPDAVPALVEMKIWTVNSSANVGGASFNVTIPPLGSKEFFAGSVSDFLCVRGTCYSPTQVFVTFEVSNLPHLWRPQFFADLMKVALPVPQIKLQNWAQVSPTVVSFDALSSQVAPFTWFETPLAGRFDDNAVLLVGGLPRRFVYYAKQAISVADLRDSLFWTTLTDTYTT